MLSDHLIIGNELYDLEGTGSDFIDQANLWTASRVFGSNVYYDCNGVYLLGGYRTPADSAGYVRGQYFEREYNSLPSHNLIIVTVIFYKLDSWDENDGDYIIFKVGDSSFQTWELHQGSGSSVCGSGYPDIANLKITMTIPHIGSSVIMRVTSHLSQYPADESSGFREVHMSFITSPNPTSSFCGLVSSFALSDRQCSCSSYNKFEQPSGSGTCYSCHSDCAMCNGPDSDNCLACPLDKYLNHLNQCVDCSAPCVSCQGSSGYQYCVTCQPGLTLFVDHTCTCTLNDYLYPDNSCKSTCTQPYKAIMRESKRFCEPYCDLTKYFYSPTLGCLLTCPDYYYPEESPKTCKECTESNCLQCSADTGHKCTKCEDNTILDALTGTCQSKFFCLFFL